MQKVPGSIAGISSIRKEWQLSSKAHAEMGFGSLFKPRTTLSQWEAVNDTFQNLTGQEPRVCTIPHLQCTQNHKKQGLGAGMRKKEQESISLLCAEKGIPFLNVQRRSKAVRLQGKSVISFSSCSIGMLPSAHGEKEFLPCCEAQKEESSWWGRFHGPDLGSIHGISG